MKLLLGTCSFMIGYFLLMAVGMDLYLFLLDAEGHSNVILTVLFSAVLGASIYLIRFLETQMELMMLTASAGACAYFVTFGVIFSKSITHGILAAIVGLALYYIIIHAKRDLTEERLFQD